MTDPGPFRTPPPVLKLEEQLRDAQAEIEDLRAENLDLKTKLVEHTRRNPEDARHARESWTWRLLIVCGIGFATWLVFLLKSCDPSPTRDQCRDTVVNANGTDFGSTGHYSCTFPGQTMSPTTDPKVYRCTCPSSPASSAP